ncbi:Copper-transporting ATPase PAA1 [Citrus sinensis]|uniref:Copper-transporting ATPase PAA1 n=1 Tax=Citrus sinensis TaxID=2711 RepID=A0ACB8ILC8_CITSI|nr:Copper-transporting ATPase PAA1 [Citrus sinensis]
MAYRIQPLTSISTQTLPFASLSRRKFSAVLPPHIQCRFECMSSCAASFEAAGGSAGGDVGGGGGDGGGGNGGSDGGDSKSKLGGRGGEELSALSSDVIILDVGGMTCGGCAASVKRILESQPQVSSASVNLTTETAIVWPVSKAKVIPNWQRQLGEALAKHLTSCGFKSSLRGELQQLLGVDCWNGSLVLRSHLLSRIYSPQSKTFIVARNDLCLCGARIGRGLAVSWALCAVCLVGHLSHILGAKASWIHVFHSTGFHLSLSLFTLLGPGFQLILDGVKSLFKGAPNMNTLVGLGAVSSFTVSSLAALVPKLGWKAFFEEPIMLIAFVLLGKNLEQRAKIKATSDMTGLLGILPSKARLLVDNDAKDSIIEVPCNSLHVGDHIVVLPGDRIPADGVVRAGRSTVDESSFTGEPLPVTKIPESEVAAGSINLNGTLTVEVRRPGGETAMGDIVRLVEEAQSREAPVQRLADQVIILLLSFEGAAQFSWLSARDLVLGYIKVLVKHQREVNVVKPVAAIVMLLSVTDEFQCTLTASQWMPWVSGHFTYGVIALSAATFVFWNLFGARVLPTAIHYGGPVSLALQLSCSVLVVACPCALGLATPTAMLVGTSLGATRGLLLRGGNILEKFAMVNTVVFDKTGTLTIGRPVVTKVVTSGSLTDPNSKQNPIHPLSETEILKFAAGVESNTVHPIGKAIVEAAEFSNCQNVKVADGTFIEEPGSGTVAIIEDRKVSVGTIDWLRSVKPTGWDLRNEAASLMIMSMPFVNESMTSDNHGVDTSTFQEVEMEELMNQSLVYVGVDNMLAGLIYVEDRIRDDAAHVVNSLSSQGIGVYMLSGDKKNSAEYVASLVGIPKDKVLSGVKPNEKKRFINELQNDENVVAMVGDGINDAAALASSHIGVAMGGGVGAASEVASVVLMGNRLSQLLVALELSRLTMKTVKQNLWWAFGYNIVGIPIAAGVLLPVTGTMLTPSIAGALMGLSSIGVMANSLLLRLKFSSKQKASFQAPSSRVNSNVDSHQLMDLKGK